ncbi:MAG: NAD(P)/FAD-dependent oxidoreductase, partial [Halobacteriaceae archaeon]
MSKTVAVLGAGYAGAGAVASLENALEDEEIVWISDSDIHFVLHEAHRIIRNPSIEQYISIPVDEIKSPATRFIQDEVTDIHPESRTIELAEGDTVAYDYCVIALGTRTAFYGIPGMAEHAHTLKSRRDAIVIRDSLRSAIAEASRGEPVEVIIGGAGLSGIQIAGEISEFRNDHGAPMNV